MPAARSPRPASNQSTANAHAVGDPRWRIGAIALLLLSSAGYLAWQEFFSKQPDNQPDQWLGAFVRVGIIMGAVWLAWPDLRRLPPWLLGLTMVLLPITCIVVARWPRYLPWFVAAGVVMYILRPRGNRRT
jgi:hypothetical protein